jgi:uncharacterized membrane protein (DUF2068 family)
METVGDRGVRAIVGYKLVRGAASLALGATVLVATASGHTGALDALLRIVRDHARADWMSMDHVASGRAVGGWATLLLAIDATASFFEGWALARGGWWGPWLVVAVTAAFIPAELAAVAKHPTAVRVLLLAINVGVALYLSRQAWGLAARVRASALRAGGRPSAEP